MRKIFNEKTLSLAKKQQERELTPVFTLQTEEDHYNRWDIMRYYKQPYLIYDEDNLQLDLFNDFNDEIFENDALYTFLGFPSNYITQNNMQRIKMQTTGNIDINSYHNVEENIEFGIVTCFFDNIFIPSGYGSVYAYISSHFPLSLNFNTDGQLEHESKVILENINEFEASEYDNIINLELLRYELNKRLKDKLNQKEMQYVIQKRELTLQV